MPLYFFEILKNELKKITKQRCVQMKKCKTISTH